MGKADWLQVLQEVLLFMYFHFLTGHLGNGSRNLHCNSILLHVLNKPTHPCFLYSVLSQFWLPSLSVDVSTTALPTQVPPTTTAILPMDLRVVDHSHHHHQQQPPFGLVPQPHPTPPASTACPTSTEPGRGPVNSKQGWSLVALCYLLQTHLAPDAQSNNLCITSYRPPGAAAAAGAGGTQTQATTPETTTDCWVPEAAWTAVTTTWSPAAGTYQGEGDGQGV